MEDFTEISELCQGAICFSVFHYTAAKFLLKEKENSVLLLGMRDFGYGLIKYTLYKTADEYFFMTIKSFWLNFKLIKSNHNLISN